MKFIKYPKIKHLGTDELSDIFDGTVVVQSKVDGANFHFWLDDGKLVFGSRNKSMEGKTDPKGWLGMVPVLEAFGKYPDKFNPYYQYYGESMQRHTIIYESITDFVGYDILNVETGLFLNWKDAKNEFESIGLQFINVHFERHGSEITIEELEKCIEKSPYRKNGDEGIVVKNYDKLNKHGDVLFGKIVTDNFKEMNRKVFKGTNQTHKTFDSNVLLADTYCTEARIEKMVYSLVDEGHKLDMSMMSILFNAVTKDIFIENISEIYDLFDKVNLNNLRGLIAKKCVPVLKRVLLERAK